MYFFLANHCADIYVSFGMMLFDKYCPTLVIQGNSAHSTPFFKTDSLPFPILENLRDFLDGLLFGTFCILPEMA